MLHQLIREQSAISIAKANEIENVRGNLHEIQAKHEETSEKLKCNGKVKQTVSSTNS